MDYNTIIETVKEIVNNDIIYKEGLTLVYKLDDKFHKQLDEHFFYQTKSNEHSEFEHSDDFEVEIGGIIIKFVKDEEE